MQFSEVQSRAVDCNFLQCSAVHSRTVHCLVLALLEGQPAARAVEKSYKKSVHNPHFTSLLFAFLHCSPFYCTVVLFTSL